MKLFFIATDRIDFGNTRDLDKLRTDDPVLHRTQCHRIIRTTVGLRRTRFGGHRIHEDFAQTGCDRPHLGFQLGRQLALDLRQPLVDSVARRVQVRTVFENSRDL